MDDSEDRDLIQGARPDDGGGRGTAPAHRPTGDSPGDDGDDAGAGAPTLTPAAVARRLGVAPATLRTWDRRYGLGPTEHTAGAHRRYSAADLARLMTMRALTLDGVPPSEAARVARTSAEQASAPRHLTPVPDLPAPAADDAAPRDADRPAPDAAGASDGHRWSDAPAGSRRTAAPTPTSVIDAALRGESEEVLRLLALAADGDVSRWWSELVAPARAGIAARTVLARPGDEPDVLVAAAALAVLRARSGRVPQHPSRRKIVLMLAAPGEPRPLSLHVLAGALADAGVDARVLAGPTGRHRLLEIATMTSPSAVVLTSEQPAPDLDMVAALAEDRPEVPVYVMVPDEAAGAVPLGRQVSRVRSFTGLLHEVLAVVG